MIDDMIDDMIDHTRRWTRMRPGNGPSARAAVAAAAAAVLLVFTLAAAARAEGPVWDESADGNDAGSVPPDAEVTTGDGQLKRIKGQTSESAGPMPDLEDMYLIRICDVDAFRASTHPGEGGSADFDTRLWLFRAPPPMPFMAFGVVANDNRPGPPTLLSLINGDPTDGSPPLMVPGRYYIAISGTPRDPRSAPGPAGEIFKLTAPTEISGPDGAGGGDPIMGWESLGPEVETGFYEIDLVAVTFGSTPFLDCNMNGTADVCDILMQISADRNDNGVPDECETSPDLDGDGDVDFNDLLLLLAAWGRCAPEPRPGTICSGDLDLDGLVGFADLLLLLAAWGP